MLRHSRPSVSVYSWGRGDLGQLGLGDEGNHSHPTLIPNLADKDILHIAASDFHSAFLTGDGELFTTGSNDSGQLGARVGELSQLFPVRVAALDMYTICHVACGQNHTVAVTDNGALASWGASEFGQLGHKEVAGKVDAVQPRIVKGSRDHQFVRVACGSAHTLALTGSGDVYSFGQGAFGALGHDSKEDVTVPLLLGTLWGLGIVQIACGEYHSAALSSDGQVFTWGRGKYGQLGHGSIESEFQPVAVKALADQFVVQVVCGGDHTIALNSEGEIFTWGRGHWGQTGLGTQDDTLTPRQVFLDGQHVVQASAGARHSVVLTASGKVFGWGDGEQGQLGMSNSAMQLQPILISDLGIIGKQLFFVVAGGEHTMAVFQQQRARTSSPQLVGRSSEDGVHEYTAGSAAGGLQVRGDPMEISEREKWQHLGHDVESSSVGSRDTTTDGGEHTVIPEVEEGMDIHGAGLRPLKLPPIMTVLNVLKGAEVSPRGLPTLSIHDLEHIFASVKFLILSFKLRQEIDGEGHEGPGLDIDLIRDAYQGILELYNPEVVKKIGAAMVRLLEGLDKHMDHVPETRWLRVLLIILQSPLIGEKGVGDQMSTRLFGIFLRISSSSEKKIVEWLRTYPKDVFGGRFVRGVQKYITNKLQVMGGKGTIPQDVVAALKVLSYLNEANKKEVLVPYSEFYSYAVSDSISYQEQYMKWLQARTQTEKNRPIVSYCQVPFILTPDAKSKILQGEASMYKQKVVQTTVVNHLFGNSFSIPFLVLNIRRTHIIHDTLLQLQAYPTYDFKKPLKVVFEGEAGIDEGGITKEFFQLLVRELFNVSYGMFTYNEESRTIWFNVNSMESESEFRLVGIVLGLAIYNGVILDIHFPMVVYKKIMEMTLNLDDLKDVQPQLWRSFQKLLEFDGDVATTFSLTFEVEYEYFGEIRTHELEPRGAEIMVTNENRRRYVDLYVKYLLEDSIDKQFKAFLSGFMLVCAGPALSLFRHEELELLICGLPHFDFDALERVTVYQGGYTKDSKVVRWFWELVRAMPLEEKKRLLFFATGNDRAPIGGLACLKFIIQKNGDDTDRLPTAHTCFNVFMLPEYGSKQKLESRLEIAIQNSTGFGLQ
ncbi:unnamed protein product [Calypogeia fissa]